MSENCYSTHEKVFMVVEYARTSNFAEVQRRFVKNYHVDTPPNDGTIKRAWDNFMGYGSVIDQHTGHSGRRKSAIVPENIAKVQAHFEENPTNSLRRAAAVLEISVTSLRRILTEQLSLHPYKIQVVQPLTEQARMNRVNFANEILCLLDENQLDLDKIWFTDEAHFWLHGFVNKQNYRFWGSELPEFNIEKPLHPEKVTVWMGICSEKLTPVTFIEGTVKGVTYTNLLNEKFGPWANRNGLVDGFWYQQDGARPHRTKEVFEILNKNFGPRVIALDYYRHYQTGIDWPAYSPDLNPCDYYLWGYLKDQVYRKDPKDVGELKAAIESAAQSIRPETLKAVIRNFKKRLEFVISGEGCHFENIL